MAEKKPQEINTDIQPSSYGFDKFQKDECAEKEFLVAAPFCPKCVIDESADVPDWKDERFEDDAFLDKTKCEYVGVIEVKLSNILSKTNQNKLKEQINEIRKEYYDKALEEYLNAPENEDLGFTLLEIVEMYAVENLRTPEIQAIWEEADKKAQEDIKKAENGYYIDTKEGKKNQSFNRLIDWARDPARIRLGIETVLDEFDKLNNNRTVCAFGGCEYSLEAVQENKKWINRYMNSLDAAQKSLVQQGVKYKQTAPALVQLILSPMWTATYFIAGAMSWVGDIFSVFGNNEAEREVAEKFDSMLTGFIGPDIKNSLERLQATYGVVNPYGCEWTAYVPDDGIYLLPNTDILRYTVRIPAINVDRLPDAVDDSDDEEQDSDFEINLDNTDWRVQYTKMWTGLTLINFDYDVFRIRDGGSIVYDKEGATSFDMVEFSPMRDSLNVFKEELEKLLNKNNMAFTYQKGNPFVWWNYLFHKTVNNVRIELKRVSDGDMDTLKITSVYVTIESCPEVKLTTKSLASFNKKHDKTEGSIKKDKDKDENDAVEKDEKDIIYKKVKYLSKFKKRVAGSVADSGLLYLLSKKDTALMAFEAEEKTPITEWAKDFIFPPVKINKGMSLGGDQDKSTLGCIVEKFPLMSAESWSDILDDLVLGFWDTFRDEMRSRMCADDASSVSPGMQRFFMSAEAQAMWEEAYEAELKIQMEKVRKKIEEDVDKRIRSDGITRGYWRKKNPADDGADDGTDDWEYVDIEYGTADISDAMNKERMKMISDAMSDYGEAMAKEATEKAAKEADAVKAVRSLHPYSKDLKEAIREGFNFEESLSKLFYDKITGKSPAAKDTLQHRMWDYISDIGLCGLILGLKKALGCLFQQVPLDEIVSSLINKAIGALNINQFIYFMTDILPIEKQLEVQEKVDKKIENLFKGTVITLKAEDVLSPSLYDKKGEGSLSNSALGGVYSGKDSISKYLTNRDTIKLQKLQSEYETDRKGKIKTYGSSNVGILKGDKQRKKDLDKITNIKIKAAKKQLRKDAKAAQGVRQELNPKNGSIGKASAEIIGIIFKAYIEAIKDAYNTSGLLQLLKNLPIINMIPDFIFDFFMCPKTPLIDPPLKDMVKFNFKAPNFCDPTRPMISWKFKKIVNPFKNPWKYLLDAMIAALTKVLTSILVKIIVQFLIELEKMLCKMLSAIGKGALDYATGNNDGSPFLEAFRDTFCGPNASDEDVKEAMAGAMSTTGIASKGDARAVAETVTAAMGGQFSKREMMLVMLKPNENPDLIRRVITVVNNSAPEMSGFFEPPSSAINFFTQLANVIPHEHKDRLREGLDSYPIPDTPIFDTICLTDEELEKWNNMRGQNLEDMGLSPEDAADIVEGANQKAKDAIEDFLAAPDSIQDTVQALLLPPEGVDPFGDRDACKDNDNRINSLVKEPDELVALSNKSLDRVWRVIDTRFIEEFSGGNDGILSRILSDTNGSSFSRHGFYRRFFITKHAIYDSKQQLENEGPHLDWMWLFGDSGFFPKTVGRYLFEEIKEQEFKFKSLPTDALKKGKSISGDWNPWIGGPEIKYKYNILKHEKPEVKLDFQIPVAYFKLFGGFTDETGKGRYSKFKQSVGYSSQILAPEIRKNFDYRISVQDKMNPFLLTGDMRTGARQTYQIEVAQPMNDEVSGYLVDFEANDNTRYRKQALEYTIGKIFNQYLPGNEITISDSHYDATLNEVFGYVRDACLDISQRDNQAGAVQVPIVEEGKATDDTESVTIPNGFLFGYIESDFAEGTLEYVGPDGEEYNYDEEEAILGKMKVPNPRVHILDPKKYGGSYANPPWYIEDAKYIGWMGMAQAMAPEMTGCKPSKENILRMNSIIEHVKSAKSKIKLNEKLFEGRGDCFFHVPFDRLIGKESRAMIEGIIKTVIRLNTVEQLIGAIPIMGFVEFNERNYDSSFFQLVSKRIQADLATMNVGWFPRKIEKTNYWLSFLEMAVMMYWRMYDTGEIEEIPEHIDEIFDELRELQEAYRWKEGMWRNPRKKQGVSSVGGIFGDRDNRTIRMPGYYYDFDKKKVIDPNVYTVPIYEPSPAFPITYDEYMSEVARKNAVYSEEDSYEFGGAYLVFPTAEDLLDNNEYSWLNPPPDATFAIRRDGHVKVGEEERFAQKPVYGDPIGPIEATAQEFFSGRDSETGEILARRASATAAAKYGGVYRVSNSEDIFTSGGELGEYYKYRENFLGYEKKHKLQHPFNFQKQYAHYCALAYQVYGDSMLYSDKKHEFGDSITFGPLKSSWQFASCMWAVRSVQDKCMIILSELVKMEMKQIVEAFNDTWKPELIDINQYMLTTKIFDNNNLKNFGTRDYEERVLQGEIADFGSVNDVVVDSYIEGAFKSTEQTDKIKFKIEKYIRVQEKELSAGETLPEPFVNRDHTLKGVVNIHHFQDFIDKNKEKYGEYYISDLFGDAEHLYEFDFEEVFMPLLNKINPPPVDQEEEGRAGNTSLQNKDKGKNTSPRGSLPRSLDAIGSQLSTPKYIEYFDKYNVELTDDQRNAFVNKTLYPNNAPSPFFEDNISITSHREEARDSSTTSGESIDLPESHELSIESEPLSMPTSQGPEPLEVEEEEETIDYGKIMLPKDLVEEEWFLIAMSNKKEIRPKDMRGSVGLKYGIRIVANLPPGSGIPEPSFENLGNSQFALEKCFYMNINNEMGQYQQNFSFPIAVAEIDIIDHQLKKFNWSVVGGESEHPLDVDCLLRLIVETPEYQTIFKHIMNPTCVTSMCTILSNISFDTSIGYKDGWEKVKEIEDEDGNAEDGDVNMEEEWDRKYFWGTKLTLRKMFSGFYLADDFEDPDVDTFDIGSIVEVAFGSMFGWLKQSFAGVSWWFRRNYQSNPFDADGEECKSEFDKLMS